MTDGTPKRELVPAKHPRAGSRLGAGASPQSHQCPLRPPSSILPWNKTSFSTQLFCTKQGPRMRGFNSSADLMGSHRQTPVYPAHTSARQGSLSPRHGALSSRTLPGTGPWGRATLLAKLYGHGAKKKSPSSLPKAWFKRGRETPTLQISQNRPHPTCHKASA